jgi:hypothetical protein
MDRDLARQDLVLIAVESRSRAALIRSRLDHSQFGDHASLVMLMADHDLHNPRAASRGPERRAELVAYLETLVSAGWHDGPRPWARTGRGPADPRWEHAVAARADLEALAGLQPVETDIEALFAVFDERRRTGRPADIPGQARQRRSRRRSTDPS